MTTTGPLELGADFVQDAHVVGAALRESAPIRHVVLPSGLPVWLVTGYEAARTVATDPRFSSQRVYDRMHRMALGEAEKPRSRRTSRRTCSTWTRRSTAGCAS